MSMLALIHKFATEQGSSWVIVGGELFDAAAIECEVLPGNDKFSHGGLRIYDGRAYHIGNVPETIP